MNYNLNLNNIKEKIPRDVSFPSDIWTIPWEWVPNLWWWRRRRRSRVGWTCLCHGSGRWLAPCCRNPGPRHPSRWRERRTDRPPPASSGLPQTHKRNLAKGNRSTTDCDITTCRNCNHRTFLSSSYNWYWYRQKQREKEERKSSYDVTRRKVNDIYFFMFQKDDVWWMSKNQKGFNVFGPSLLTQLPWQYVCNGGKLM